MHIPTRVVGRLGLLVVAVGLWGCGASGPFTKTKKVTVAVGGQDLLPIVSRDQNQGLVEGYVYQNKAGELTIFPKKPTSEESQGLTPTKGVVVQVTEVSAGGQIVTDELGFFHIVCPEIPASTPVTITVQTKPGNKVEQPMETSPLPIHKSFVRKKVHINRPDIPSNVEVEVRSISLRATVYNDGDVPVTGMLFFRENDDTAPSIDETNVKDLATPLFTLTNPGDPQDQILDAGESWFLESGSITERSLFNLLKRMPAEGTDIYVYGLLEPENGNVSVCNVKVTVKAEGGLSLW